MSVLYDLEVSSPERKTINLFLTGASPTWRAHDALDLLLPCFDVTVMMSKGVKKVLAPARWGYLGAKSELRDFRRGIEERTGHPVVRGWKSAAEVRELQTSLPVPHGRLIAPMTLNTAAGLVSNMHNQLQIAVHGQAIGSNNWKMRSEGKRLPTVAISTTNGEEAMNVATAEHLLVLKARGVHGFFAGGHRPGTGDQMAGVTLGTRPRFPWALGIAVLARDLNVDVTFPPGTEFPETLTLDQVGQHFERLADYGYAEVGQPYQVVNLGPGRQLTHRRETGTGWPGAIGR